MADNQRTQDNLDPQSTPDMGGNNPSQDMNNLGEKGGSATQSGQDQTTQDQDFTGSESETGTDLGGSDQSGTSSDTLEEEDL